MQIGVDVGGTNTDGVIMSDGKVLVSDKKVTTANVGDGVFNVIKSVLDKGKISADKITSVMVGTTHFTNALVERKKLTLGSIITKNSNNKIVFTSIR